MRRLVRTFVGLSTAAALAALAPGVGVQAEAKQTPPATEKKQPPPPPEKKQPPPATEKKQTTPAAEKAQKPAAGKHVMFAPGDLKWGPAPSGLPAGAELAVLDGDPGKAGLFTIRIKAPDGYTVQPHWHPTDEHLTVLSGNMMMGTGSKWDDSAMHEATAGTYAKMPRRVNHYVKAKGETIFQLTAMGPFQITYVNSTDDPRKKTTAK